MKDNIFSLNLEKSLVEAEKEYWISEDVHKKLLGLLNQVSYDEGIGYIFSELKKYSPQKTTTKTLRFRELVIFLKYIGNNGNIKFKDNIINFLKEELNYQAKQDKPELYSVLIDTIFSIYKSDKDFYKNQFNNLKQDNKLFYDINKVFMRSFIYFKEQGLFIQSFKQVIIDNTEQYIYSSLKKGWEYIIGLDDINFKAYIEELLELFSDEKEKEKLVKHYEYLSLMQDNTIEKYKVTYDNFAKKIFLINDQNFAKKIFNFLVGEISFALKEHQKNIEDIYLISIFSDFTFKQDKNFIIKILDNLSDKKHYLFGLEKYIINYLQEEDIDNLIKNLENRENSSNMIYFIYDWLERDIEKKDLFLKYKSSKKYKIKFEDRDKKIKEDLKKQKRNRYQEKYKYKKQVLKLVDLKDGQYSPRLFQDYARFIEERDNKYNKNYTKDFSSIFTKKELDTIISSIKKQLLYVLKWLVIDNYSEKIKTHLIYEKKGDKHMVPSFIADGTLERVLILSKELGIDIKKYRKGYIFYYPYLWNNENLDILKNDFINDIENEDIDYIINIYIKEKFPKAIDLRFYHPENLINFFTPLIKKLKVEQKNKLIKILERMIKSNIISFYVKQRYIELYSKIIDKDRLKKFIRNFNKNFNYFNDVLLNINNIEQNIIENYKVYSLLNGVLIERFKDNNSIKWRLEQIKDGIIEVSDPGRMEYPQTSSGVYGVTDGYNEIRKHSKYETSFLGKIAIIGDIKLKDKFLDFLNLSFEILDDIRIGKRGKDYDGFAYYLQANFLIYIKKLNKEYKKEDLYSEINNIINKYSNIIFYRQSEIDDIFGYSELDKKADKIKGNKREIKKILKDIENLIEKNTELKLTNDKLLKKVEKYKPYYEPNNKAILIVEGNTDKEIIETAWNKLYGDTLMDFTIKPAFGYKNLNVLFSDITSSGIFDYDKIVIGLFDYDSAYEKFEELYKKPNWDIIKNNILSDVETEPEFIGKEDIGEFDDIILKYNENGTNTYVMLLPVPKNKKNIASHKLKNMSLISIEMLFEEKLFLEQEKEIKYFPGKNSNTEIVSFRNDRKIKTNFANRVDNFEAMDFQNFIPLFDNIKMIIGKKGL